MQTKPEGQSGRTITVVLVNMDGIVNDLLRSALESSGLVHVIACAANGEQLATALDVCCPDVALIGVEGWARNTNASALLEQLASAAPSTRTVVMASEMSREDVISMFYRGARGLVCSSGANISLLTKCIECVAKGQIWASASQLEALICSLSVPKSFKVTNVLGHALLSKREEQVLLCLAEGMSNRELATALNLSEHTVKNHLFRIFDKLGVSNRMEAVLYAISQREQKSAHRLSAKSPVAPPSKGKLPEQSASIRFN